MRTLKIVALSCAALVSGCSHLQTPAPLYQLSSASFMAPSSAANTPVIAFTQLDIAQYLRGHMLIQRMDDTTLIRDNALWAVDLDTSIRQWLVLQLAATLDTQAVFEALPGNLPVDASIELQISRLDSGPNHAAVLDAKWQVLKPAGTVVSSRVLRLIEDHDASHADQVRAQSVLLERLTKELGASVQEALAKAPVPIKPEPIAQPSTPIRPKAKPARSVETFRF